MRLSANSIARILGIPREYDEHDKVEAVRSFSHSGHAILLIGYIPTLRMALP